MSFPAIGRYFRHSFADPGRLDVVFGIHIPPQGIYMSFSANGCRFRDIYRGGRPLAAETGLCGA